MREAYGAAYAGKTDDYFFQKMAPVYLCGKPMLLRIVDYKKALLTQFAKTLNEFSAESVLELGCGRGLNLLALAVLVPSLRFAHGVELTAEGAAATQGNFASPEIHILEELTGLPRESITSRLSQVSFSVEKGSMLKLPFPDSSFDVVFSNSAIEQVPREYPNVFSEAYRVARRAGIFSEPFEEAQGWNFLYRMYLRNIDYFCASYRAVEKAGWRISAFSVPTLQKAEFNTGFLVCEKN